MKPVDILLAVAVAVILGLAFVASRIALDEWSPALMTMLRFVVAAVPCLFVVRGMAVMLLSKRPQPVPKIA
jgi:O-acetylserine/cysteine efflux transporter